MSDIELKPCPFCGGKAEYWRLFEDESFLFGVECVECSVYTNTFSTKEEAAKIWNKRTGGVK